MQPTSAPVILQILPSLVTGGVERGTVEITDAIARAGGTALVASSGGPLVAEIERAGGRHITLPLATKSPLGIWRNADRLTALIQAERVGIVHARSRAPAWSGWLASRMTGAHFITTYHGTYSENLPFKRRYNAVMARGEIVIAASRFIAETIQRQHGLPEERIRVIPRGIDPAVFDPAAVAPERTTKLARDWGVPKEAPVLMLPGRLTAWKGQSVLIEALPRLRHHTAHAVLVGSDQGRRRYTADLLALAKRLGVAERVHLAGNCADMPGALMLADVVVHASTQAEAFGRVVIEAQAMGRLVVAADLGGPVETVAHGVTGWRVLPGDAAALAAAIDHALALSPQERQATGERARMAVLRGATVQGMQQATLDVYETVLRKDGLTFPARERSAEP
jgi:glycosyltransferase involved in cell wall biosynthesis